MTSTPSAPDGHPDDVALAAYLAGEAPVGDAGRLAGHVPGCADCAARVDQLRAASAVLDELAAEAPPAPDPDRRSTAIRAALLEFDAARGARHRRRRWRLATIGAAASAAAVAAGLAVGLTAVSGPAGAGGSSSAAGGPVLPARRTPAGRPAAAGAGSRTGVPSTATAGGALQLRPVFGPAGCRDRRSLLAAAASGVVSSDLGGAGCVRVGPAVAVVPVSGIPQSYLRAHASAPIRVRVPLPRALRATGRPLVAVLNGRVVVARARTGPAGRTVVLSGLRPADLPTADPP